MKTINSKILIESINNCQTVKQTKEFRTFKTYVNKEFENCFQDLKENYKIENCFFIHFDKIEKGLKTAFNYLLENLKTENDLKTYLIFDKNSKVKDSIRAFSIKPYLLCPNMINGSCKISKICYASKQELASQTDKQGAKRYYSLEKTLKNFIFYHYILFINDKENNYKFLRESLKVNPEVKKGNILRLNMKSDYEDQRHLNFTNDLFEILKTEYNYILAYGYTKTENLKKDCLAKEYTVNDSIIIESKQDLRLIQTDKAQYITVLNPCLKDKVKELVKIKCKYQTTENLTCNLCQQCFKVQAKYNDPH